MFSGLFWPGVPEKNIKLSCKKNLLKLITNSTFKESTIRNLEINFEQILHWYGMNKQLFLKNTGSETFNTEWKF